jgi:hypothetical protein
MPERRRGITAATLHVWLKDSNDSRDYATWSYTPMAVIFYRFIDFQYLSLQLSRMVFYLLHACMKNARSSTLRRKELRL